MCFEVTNTTDAPIAVIYSQFTAREIVPDVGVMSELVLPSGLSAVVAEQPHTETEETRHRLTIPANGMMTIRYAASVEIQDGVTATQIADYEAPQEDGPIA